MSHIKQPALSFFALFIAFPLSTLLSAPIQSESKPSLHPGIVQTQDDPKTYSEIMTRIRSNEREINRLFSSIPIGFPEKQKLYLEKIKILKEENAVYTGRLNQAAIDAFRSDPEGNSKAGPIVLKQIIRKLDPTMAEHAYDPQGALEIADMMMKAGLDDGENEMAIQFRDVAYLAFRASYAIQDFGRAELMLQKIADRGIELKPRPRQLLEATRKNWKRELMIRRLENNTNDLPLVKFQTSEGDFVVELFENHAPQTVGNFISLVEAKFYDDKPFFLVQPGRFSQTGCPKGDGTGDAGYKIPCECYREQIRHHFTGTLSMANAGPDTGGSQFFIAHQPRLDWDGHYTAFGRVREGMDVVYKFTKVDGTKPKVNDLEPSKIIQATVLRKRSHQYVPTRHIPGVNDSPHPASGSDTKGSDTRGSDTKGSSTSGLVPSGSGSRGSGIQGSGSRSSGTQSGQPSGLTFPSLDGSGSR